MPKSPRLKEKNHWNPFLLVTISTRCALGASTLVGFRKKTMWPITPYRKESKTKIVVTQGSHVTQA